MRALAQYVMRGPMQAGGVAAVATALPLLFWIGAAVIGLVILRLGIRQGLNIGLWAVLPALGWATFGQDPTALVVLLQVMLMASILRTSLSWERALMSGAFLMILTGLMMPLMYPALLDELRSEEHTSELQSRPHLVCRLLLEKKKNGLCVRPCRG